MSLHTVNNVEMFICECIREVFRCYETNLYPSGCGWMICMDHPHHLDKGLQLQGWL